MEGGLLDYKVHHFSKAQYNDIGESLDPKDVLGGKGASLVMMTDLALPVPPGYILPTRVSRDYQNLITEVPNSGSGPIVKFKESLITDVVLPGDEVLTQDLGYVPLVSVRSGSRDSMPGMMDTILNVGLTRSTLPYWETKLGKATSWGMYIGLLRSIGTLACGIPDIVFNSVFDGVDMNNISLETIALGYETSLPNHILDLVGTRQGQLWLAVSAVLESWNSARAKTYRKLNGISDDVGTAVIIQKMVFGNIGANSGTGVVFTRDPATGERGMCGEYLPGAQGEDLVSGVHTPQDLRKYLDEGQSVAWEYQLMSICSDLEMVYKDMVDIEFTVEDNTLWILQSRVGKRSAKAAFKIAVDMVNSGHISKLEALTRLSAGEFKAMRRKGISSDFKECPHGKGIPASPGIAKGVLVYSSEEALKSKVPCILYVNETSPKDIGGMSVSAGILTKHGGFTAHAAVVARSMNIPCVVGYLGDLPECPPGTVVTIDGSSGNIWVGVDVSVTDNSDCVCAKEVTNWCVDLTNSCWFDFKDVVVEPLDRLLTIDIPAGISEFEIDCLLERLGKLPSRDHIVLRIIDNYGLNASEYMLSSCMQSARNHYDICSFILDRLTCHTLNLRGLGVIIPESLASAYLESLDFNGIYLCDAVKRDVMHPNRAVFTILNKFDLGG